MTAASGELLYEASRSAAEIASTCLSLIQEGLRGVVPGGTAHALDSRDFPVPVKGKTGTTSDFRDALFAAALDRGRIAGRANTASASNAPSLWGSAKRRSSYGEGEETVTITRGRSKVL